MNNNNKGLPAMMNVNSGQIDLNADAMLHDRENEVLGFNSLASNVSVGGETLASEPVGACDHKVFGVGGNDGGYNSGFVEAVSEAVMVGFGMNGGCDVMVDGIGKNDFEKGAALVGGENGLEAGLGLDVGSWGKQDEFFGGFTMNDDMKITMGCSEGGSSVCGGAGSDGGFAFGSNGVLRNEMEWEDGRRFAENSLLSDECAQGIGNVRMIGGVMKMEAADNLLTKEGHEDSHASEITTFQVHYGFPVMGVADVNAKEVFGDHHVLASLYDVKPPAFHVDAQVGALQNQTLKMSGHFDNSPKECHDGNLIVDLNHYKNMLDVDLCRGWASPEQNFCVSDLVWGKVMGHPWWPGQIVDCSAASEKAKRHFKKDHYLIVYFGDQTFAWNDSPMIKPFQLDFTQMVKQSNSESFLHAVDCALDEVSRRVGFGLSCPCMPEDAFSKLKTQVIMNSGICGELRRDGGDRFINAMSFEPTKLVDFVKSLAKSPLTESDGMDFSIAHAQLLAFNRSKGYSQLPEFHILGGLLDDQEILLLKENEQLNDQTGGRGLTTYLGLEQKCKHSSGNQTVRRGRGRPRKIVCNIPMELEKKPGDQTVRRGRGRPRKIVCNIPMELDKKAGDLIVQWIPMELEKKAGDQKVRRGRGRPRKEKSMVLMDAGETGVTSVESAAPMTSAMEVCNDSYWTDRVIQCISKEQPSIKNENGIEGFFPGTQTQSSYPFSKSQSAPETSAGGNQGSEPSSSKLVEHLEISAEDFTPTALSLKFSSLDSVPSITDLNKIFCRFGPLIESLTELIEKSKRAKVVFKRRRDAETAFSSAGKYSIFGPALVSYRLKILPPKKVLAALAPGKRGRKSKEAAGKPAKKSKEETSNVHGAAV